MVRTYEIEKLVDYVRVEVAYEELYKNKNEEFASIFAKGRFKKIQENPETYTSSRYFYKVKWLGFDRNNTTWEPEDAIPNDVYLAEFKKLNNLGSCQGPFKVEMVLDKRKAYSEYKILPFVAVPAVDVDLAEFSPVVLDSVDNGRFGVVPVPANLNLNQKPPLFFTQNQAYYLLKNNVYEKVKAGEIVETIKSFHHDNKCFIQGYIRHENIVEMLDSFYSYDPISEHLRISSVFEECQHTLRWKILNGGVDWKCMIKHVLIGLAHVHPYGIHQGLSMDNILFGSNGKFKISHFNDFTFSKSIDAMDVKCTEAELSPRKFGLEDKFDFSLDIYALAMLVLHCSMRGDVVRWAVESLADVEKDIQRGLDNLETDEERHLIRMMIQARRHIHQGSGSYRFSAHALSWWPLLSHERMESVECYFMNTTKSVPIIDRVYYTDDDDVETVTDRIASFYGTNSYIEYRMLCSTKYDRTSTADLISLTENFKSCVHREMALENKKFLILPILKPCVDSELPMQNYVVLYRQELGGFPIIVESAELNPTELLLLLKREVVSDEYQHCTLQLFPKNPRVCEDQMPMYGNNFYLLQIMDLPDAAIKNRLDTMANMNKPLTGDMLKWSDVAGLNNLSKVKMIKPVVAKKRQFSSVEVNETEIDTIVEHCHPRTDSYAN